MGSFTWRYCSDSSLAGNLQPVERGKSLAGFGLSVRDMKPSLCERECYSAKILRSELACCKDRRAFEGESAIEHEAKACPQELSRGQWIVFLIP